MSAEEEFLLRTLIGVRAALVLLFLLAMCIAVPILGLGIGMESGTLFSSWPWLLGLLVMYVAFICIGLGFYAWLARTDGTRDLALEELRLAYARGEMSDEEFERRRERLQREE